MGVEKTFEQVKARGHLVLGITSAGTANDISQRIMKGVLGVDFWKQISGYPGSTEVKLAMERGEVDGTCVAHGAKVPPDWEQRGEIAPYMNFGSFRPDNMPKNVPFALDYARTDRDRAIINVLMGNLDHRPALHHVALGCRRPYRAPAQGFRRDDEGPGLHCRRDEAQYARSRPRPPRKRAPLWRAFMRRPTTRQRRRRARSWRK